MIRKQLFLIFACGLGLLQAAVGKELIVKEFDIQPLTRYRVLFQAESETKAHWELRTLNQRGDLPHIGCLKQDWQTIEPGQQEYQHSFWTAPDAAKLQLICNYDTTAPVFDLARIDEITGENLIINGDFASGANNFSGWNDVVGGTLVEKEGETVLELVPDGYALTDPVPVNPGGVYTFPKGSSKGQVLVYNADMLHVDDLPFYHHHRNTDFIMPDDAAYVRLSFFIRWPHVTPVMTIDNVGFGEVEDAPPAAALPMAQDEIVLAATADIVEVRAARELQHWVRMITGRQMPVLARPSSANNLKIHVGRAWANRFPEDLQALEDTDGFAVRRDGKNIYVFGAKPAGSIFGAIRLLEENTDIIWARPHRDFGTVYSTQPRIEFTNCDFRSIPAFPARMMSFPGGLPMTDTVFWMSRLGLNTPMHLRGGGFNHDLGVLKAAQGSYFTYLFKIYPLAEMEEKHLDFFPMIDGKRMVKQHWLNPCFSNPEVVKTLVEGVRRTIIESPHELDYLLTMQADTFRVCACPSCMQPIELPDGTLREPKSPYSEKDPQFFSTRMFMMMNQMAEELVKEFPDVKLMCHAYIFSAEPPLVPVHPAIKPQYAAYSTRTVRAPLLDGKANGSWGTIWEERFRAWMKLHKDNGLSFFGYYNLPGFSAVADAYAADMRALAEAGGYAVHNESSPDVDFPNKYTGNGQPYTFKWDADAIERWVIARNMWDPDLDPQELREYYIGRTFREAAPPMREFFNLIRESWHDPSIKANVNCHISHRELFKTFIVDPGLEKRARKLLVQAEAQAVHPNSKIMVQRTLARFDDLGSLLNREVVPWVPESTHDWNFPTSPHWEKAAKFQDFKKVDDWRVFNKAAAEQQTVVSAMSDDNFVYFRFIAYDSAVDKVVVSPTTEDECFPNGDRIELVLSQDSGKHYYFTVGPNGNNYDARNWQEQWDSQWQVAAVQDNDSWTATFAIPLQALELDPENPRFDVRFGRVHRLQGPEREESTLAGASLYNRHKSFWTSLTVGTKGN